MRQVNNLFQVKSIRDFMYKTYANMSISIFIAFSTSLLAYSVLPVNMFTFFIILGSIFFVTNETRKLASSIYYQSTGELLKSFLLISVLEGIILFPIYNIANTTMIMQALMSTIITFSVVSAYGYSTNSDLSQYVQLVISGVIACVISSVVGGIFMFIFLPSAWILFDMVICSIMSVITVALIAISTQQLKNMYYASSSDQKNNLSIFGAIHMMQLFIALFRFILHIMHYFSRRD